MNELLNTTVNVGLLLRCVFFITCWVVFFRIITLRKATKQQKQRLAAINKKKQQPYAMTYGGWVAVNKEALKAIAEEVIDDISLLGVVIPAHTVCMLYNLSNWDRHELVKSISNNVTPYLPYLEDKRRGLTIGSALFNYTIPESFVLLDRRTRLLYARYRFEVAERKSYEQWLSGYPDFFAQQHRWISDAEGLMNFNKGDLQAFYIKYIEKISVSIIAYAGKENIPPINSMTAHLLASLRLPDNEYSSHGIRMCVTTVLRNTGLSVPKDWLMLSKLTDQMFNIVNDVEEEQQGLTLVVNNNPKQFEDKNVW